MYELKGAWGNNIPYSIYMQSDRNIDISDGIQLWYGVKITFTNADSLDSFRRLLSPISAHLIFSATA